MVAQCRRSTRWTRDRQHCSPLYVFEPVVGLLAPRHVFHGVPADVRRATGAGRPDHDPSSSPNTPGNQAEGKVLTMFVTFRNSSACRGGCPAAFRFFANRKQAQGQVAVPPSRQQPALPDADGRIYDPPPQVVRDVAVTRTTSAPGF